MRVVNVSLSNFPFTALFVGIDHSGKGKFVAIALPSNNKTGVLIQKYYKDALKYWRIIRVDQSDSATRGYCGSIGVASVLRALVTQH